MRRREVLSAAASVVVGLGTLCAILFAQSKGGGHQHLPHHADHRILSGAPEALGVSSSPSSSSVSSAVNISCSGHYSRTSPVILGASGRHDSKASGSSAATARELRPTAWQSFLPVTAVHGGKKKTVEQPAHRGDDVGSIGEDYNGAKRRKRKQAIENIVSGGRPVLIKDSPATTWSAVSKWTWESLASRILYIRDVRSQVGNPVFTLRAEDVEGGMLGGRERNTVTHVPKMAFRDFLDLAATDKGQEAAASRQYLYYTAPLEAWAPAGLPRDVQGWEDLFAVKDKGVMGPSSRANNNSRSSSNQSESSVAAAMLWLSHPGVTAQCHYDKSHNFLLQIIGTKRVTLYGPWHHSHLYQYPALHVAHRQSQVDVYSSSAPRGGGGGATTDHDFPLFRKAKPMQVVLSPGDVLYVPPYWYHMVEAMPATTTTRAAEQQQQQPSLSLSVVSPSLQEKTLAQAYWHLLPFKSLNSTMERVIGAQTYLVHLLSRAEGTGGPYKAARWLYRSRYSYLYPMTGIFMTNSRFMCYEEQPEDVARIRASLSKREIIDAVTAVSSIINEKRVISKAVRQTWLGDYMEELARWAMGGPESVPLFLTQCLNFEPIPLHHEVEGPPVIRLGTEEGEQG